MIDKTQWNTRERALSTDLNRAMSLVERGILEGLCALASGSVKRSGCFGNSFLVTPVAGTMTSSISAGIAFLINSANVYPSSSVDWIESRVVRQVTHDAADVQTRYDVVEMRAGYEVSSSQPRDQFNPVTGTFTVVNMAKELASYPEFRVVKGTPAASPVLPDGSAGWMPLAYVRVVGGALTLAANDVIYCRPLLDTEPPRTGWEGAATVFSDEVNGGNVSSPGGTLTATVVETMTGRFPGYHHKFRLATLSTCTLSSALYDGGGLPGASGHVYFYAIPAPYPAGYDNTLAGREFWTPDTANVYAAAGGFSNAGRQSGCIVIASSTAPGSTKSGAPSTAVAQFSHPLFGTGLTTSSDRAYWMYIGSAWYDIVSGFILEQAGAKAIVGHTRKTGANVGGLIPIAADTTVSVASDVGGLDPEFALPSHVRRVHLVSVNRINAQGHIYIRYKDAFYSASTAYKTYTGYRSLAMAESDYGLSDWIELDSSQSFVVSLMSGDQLGAVQYFRVMEWEDPVLALR